MTRVRSEWEGNVNREEEREERWEAKGKIFSRPGQSQGLLYHSGSSKHFFFLSLKRDVGNAIVNT